MDVYCPCGHTVCSEDWKTVSTRLTSHNRMIKAEEWGKVLQCDNGYENLFFRVLILRICSERVLLWSCSLKEIVASYVQHYKFPSHSFGTSGRVQGRPFITSSRFWHPCSARSSANRDAHLLKWNTEKGSRLIGRLKGCYFFRCVVSAVTWVGRVFCEKHWCYPVIWKTLCEIHISLLRIR